MKSLLARLSQLEENQGKLEKSNKELKETNRIMMAKFSSLARPASQPEQQVILCYRIIWNLKYFRRIYYDRS